MLMFQGAEMANVLVIIVYNKDIYKPAVNSFF